MRSRLMAYAPALLLALLIFYLSATPSQNLARFNLLSFDKLAHAAAYAVLTLACFWGLWKQTAILAWKDLLGWTLACSFYGASLEWMQANFFPSRSFDYADMLANCIGAGIALLLALWRKRQLNA